MSGYVFVLYITIFMSWFCPKWFLFLISLVLGTMFHLAVPHTLAVLRLFSSCKCSSFSLICFFQMFCFSSPMLKNYDKCSQFLMFCFSTKIGLLCSADRSFCKRKCSAHCSSMFTSCAHILVLINCSVLLYFILIMFIHSC